VLDSEARHYEPDSPRIRAALYERLDGAARGTRRRSPLGFRLAGIPAGIAAAVLCGTVAVAVTATVENHPRPPQPTSANGGALPAASQSPSTDSSAQAASHGTQSAVSGHSASPSAPAPTGGRPASASASVGGGSVGLIAAVGAVDASSNASWSQENVNITLAEPVSAFQLTVKVSTSAGLSSTGDWTNYDISMFDVTVTTQSDGIVYDFRLKSGRTLQPGSAEFAVQFGHGVSHNAADDTYYASVVTDKAHGSAPGVSQGAF
jgi:hypothetical protein